MRHTRSTSDVPPKERLECWHSLARDIFADVSFHCENDTVESFNGLLSSVQSGSLDIFELSTEAHKVHRATKGNSAPAILLTLQLEGEGYISQDGRTDILKPGDFTLFDSSRPFDLQFKAPITQCVLRIPWASVKQQLISTRRITGKSIRGSSGPGYVASSFIRSFVREAPALTKPEAERLLLSMIDIVNTSALSVIGQASRKTSDYCAFQVHRIRLFIEDNLRNPDLSPALIAAGNGMSQRYLNKLFETEGVSVGRLLWERRLDKCLEDLEDPLLAGKSITEIAYSWGFKSSSHFSRTFKERFGISPREVRTTVA